MFQYQQQQKRFGCLLFNRFLGVDGNNIIKSIAVANGYGIGIKDLRFMSLQSCNDKICLADSVNKINGPSLFLKENVLKTNDFLQSKTLLDIPSFEQWEHSKSIIDFGNLINDNTYIDNKEHNYAPSILLSSVLKKRRSKMSKHQRKKRRKRDRMKNENK